MHILEKVCTFLWMFQTLRNNFETLSHKVSSRRKISLHFICQMLLYVWHFRVLSPKMKSGLCCRRRKMQSSGPSLRSMASLYIELERLCCAISMAFACISKIMPDNKLTSQKNNPIRHFQKNFQFNHWPFISGYICPGTPSFDLPTPNFAGSSYLNSVPGSGPGTES